ncbi:hypothetical protein [Halostella salina]|uniref:hypothetical protein n=1 Tax=Halostella salina TaxID=1547897 RepID=UPI000EF7F3BC|nr:hypothetical protein [Halostella salina]
MTGVLQSLFDSYIEIHTAQLGVLLGLFVGVIYRERPTLAYAVLTVGVLSAFGYVPTIGFVLYDHVAAVITVKPWYFLSALYVSTVANLLAVDYGPALWRQTLGSSDLRRDGVVEDDNG